VSRPGRRRPGLAGMDSRSGTSVALANRNCETVMRPFLQALPASNNIARILLLAGLVFQPALASAHHEAIFGPQSSLIMSADKFVSVQVFGRELGTSESKTHETTTLMSAGVRVSKRRPLTFTAILPYSWISEPGQVRTSGSEDFVLGLRYRDFKDVTAQDGYRFGTGMVYAR
jgi:hypothetical protein